MRFFVSSRMRELFVERKVAIEAVHFAGHTPIYIETEPEVKDEAARETMDSLLKDSDGFISIHYLSEGRRDKVLGFRTPIEYELEHFRELHKKALKQKNAHILLFRQKSDKFNKPHENMIDFFDQQAKDLKIKIIEFKTPDELSTNILVRLTLRKYKKDLDILRGNRYIIRYSGPDYIGMIARASEIIFTNYKLNIDYITQAARGGLATLYASCSQRFPAKTSSGINMDRLKKDLRKGIRTDLKKAIKQKRLVKGADPNAIPSIKVDKDKTPRKPFQFYVELRTINAPGQINSVCKVLRDHGFNIDELEQKPTSSEFKRQASVCLWLSKPSWLSKKKCRSEKEIQKEISSLEVKIRHLIGVRAFSIKVVRYMHPC